MTPREIDRKFIAPHLAPGSGASRKGMTIGANAGDEQMLQCVKPGKMASLALEIPLCGMG
ncbi:MAG TPA: hypothetical protein VHM93_02020 [Candidatus Acidoferrum sp.]|jgi:hypothetical protein|nr:hypothetical protein [Candidatus Acidoferrum sp.]